MPKANQRRKNPSIKSATNGIRGSNDMKDANSGTEKKLTNERQIRSAKNPENKPQVGGRAHALPPRGPSDISNILRSSGNDKKLNITR